MSLQSPGPNNAKLSNIFLSTLSYGGKTKCMVALYQTVKFMVSMSGVQTLFIKFIKWFVGMSWYPYLFQIMTIDCTISWHGFSDAERERYLNCDVYTHSADIPTQNTICHRHFTQRKFYCRTWQCETPRCPLRRQIPRAGDCSYCPSKSMNFNIRILVHLVLVNKL